MKKKAKKTLEEKEVDAMSDLVSISQAAELRSVSHAAIQDLIKRGRLTTVEIGGRRFLRRSEVTSYKPAKAGRPKSS